MKAIDWKLARRLAAFAGMLFLMHHFIRWAVTYGAIAMIGAAVVSMAVCAFVLAGYPD